MNMRNRSYCFWFYGYIQSKKIIHGQNEEIISSTVQRAYLTLPWVPQIQFILKMLVTDASMSFFCKQCQCIFNTVSMNLDQIAANHKSSTVEAIMAMDSNLFFLVFLIGPKLATDSNKLKRRAIKNKNINISVLIVIRSS